MISPKEKPVVADSRVPSIWILGIACSLSPLGMTIVIPALASIGERFDANFGVVQFVVSAYLFGLALAQPICGFFCDKYGRRPVMLIGFGFFAFASLFCGLATSLEQLIVARFFQAVGVSVGTVASRAILRDSRDSEKLVESMSYISAMMGIAPIVAPVFGGAIDSIAGYSWIFLATTIVGAVVFLKMFFGLSETLPRDFERPRIAGLISSYRIVLSSKVFLGNTLIFGFLQGSFFAFVAIGSKLFASSFGIQSSEFGVLWALMAVLYVAGATASARLVPRIGSARVMKFSVGFNVLSGILVLVFASMGELSVLKVLVPFSLLMIFSGAAMPGAMAGAVADHPSRAGSATGLSSALGLAVGGVFSILSGTLYQGDYQTIALIICLSNLAAGFSWLLIKARPGEL